MSFAARTLGYLAVNDTIATFTLSYAGIGTNTFPPSGTAQFWGWFKTGWTAVGGAGIGPNFPSAALNTFVSGIGTIKGVEIIGAYSGDNGGTFSGTTYYVIVLGDQSANSGLITNMSIGGTNIPANTKTNPLVSVGVLLSGVTTAVTRFTFTVTSPTTTLFGTSGSQTIIVS
jgi:hypothetical protein